MIVDVTAWAYGLAGGLMIGLAATMFLLVNGHIMGASGLVGGLVDGSGRANATERAAFLIGLAGVPFLLTLIVGAPDTHITSNMVVIAAGGLLVGIGTRIANGCTSGHGVCGISRFSLRGFVATIFYLLGGGASVLLFRHVLGVI